MVSAPYSLITRIETMSFKALPALERRYYDGWLLRYSNGYTRRANSVNPVYASYEDVELKISQCEAFYHSKQRPTIFKMTDAVYPENLDAILADDGYHKEATTHVLTCSLDQQSSAPDNIHISTRQTPEWIEHFVRLNKINKDYAKTVSQMLKLISTPCGYLSLLDDKQVVGVALGVLDDGWMGIFDVVVDAGQRGKGYGRAVVQSLMSWGKTQGAHHAYLQVQGDNEGAIQLYEKLGFTRQYSYWYRVK